jgi:nicotinamidase-related amidase
MTAKKMNAEPYEFEFNPATTALVVIDMQRDFVEPGGFGEALGNDVTPLQAVIPPCKRVLEAARRSGMMVIHTREGHSPDLADCPPSKTVRGEGIATRADGILIRGEARSTSCPSFIKAGRSRRRQAGQGRVLRH